MSLISKGKNGKRKDFSCGRSGNVLIYKVRFSKFYKLLGGYLLSARVAAV